MSLTLAVPCFLQVFLSKVLWTTLQQFSMQASCTASSWRQGALCETLIPRMTSHSCGSAPRKMKSWLHQVKVSGVKAGISKSSRILFSWDWHCVSLREEFCRLLFLYCIISYFPRSCFAFIRVESFYQWPKFAFSCLSVGSHFPHFMLIKVESVK